MLWIVKRLVQVIVLSIALFMVLDALRIQLGWIAPAVFLAVVFGNGMIAWLMERFVGEETPLKLVIAAFVFLTILIAAVVALVAVGYTGGVWAAINVIILVAIVVLLA